MNTAISEAEQLYWNIFETASDGILIVDLETGCVLVANLAAAKIHGYARQALVGLQLQRLIHAKSLPLFVDYALVLQRGDLFETTAQHVRRDDSQLSVEWRAVAFKYQSRICALVFLRDVSKRVQAERQLQQRVGVRAYEQATLLEISQTLASTLELQPDLILDQLGKLIQYTHAGLFTLEDSTLVALAVRGIEPLEQAVPLHIRLDSKQMLESLFNGHRPIRIADLSSDEPPAKFLHTLLKNDSAALLEGVQAWMWVPLVP